MWVVKLAFVAVAKWENQSGSTTVALLVASKGYSLVECSVEC
jgi:hypothetical protein